MHDLTTFSATELAAMIRLGTVSSEEIVDAHLRQIDRHNTSINAIVTIDAARAIESAREADRAISRGEVTGPLHGVPVTIKDAISTADLRTVCGCEELRDYKPLEDATVVMRIRAAGAIVIGKTNVPERSSGMHCDNPVFGRTNNPWDTNRSPGGSTGGGAAAVASGMTPLELGADIGGSVRIPANFSGVYSIKPTEHRVPLTGHIPPLPGLPRAARHQNTIGPLARSIDDLELALQVIAGPDARDVLVPAVPCFPEEASSIADLRIGWSDCFGGVRATEDTSRALEQLAGALEANGAEVHRELPHDLDILDVWETHRSLLYSEACSILNPDEQQAMVEAGYLSAIEVWEGPGGKQRRSIERAANGSSADVHAIFRERDAHMSTLERYFQHRDVYLAPVTATPAIPHAPPGTPVFVDHQKLPYWLPGVAFTAPFSLTGSPCAVITLTESSEGLPIGVQVIGRRWGDMQVLAIARALLPYVRGYRRPPGF